MTQSYSRMGFYQLGVTSLWRQVQLPRPNQLGMGMSDHLCMLLKFAAMHSSGRPADPTQTPVHQPLSMLPSAVQCSSMRIYVGHQSCISSHRGFPFLHAAASLTCSASLCRAYCSSAQARPAGGICFRPDFVAFDRSLHTVPCSPRHHMKA